MIKAEETRSGMRVEGKGDNATLMSEFTAIIQTLIQNDVLNEELYETAWKLATLEGEEKIKYMKDEITKGIKTKMDDGQSAEDILNELEKSLKDLIEKMEK